MIVDTFSGAIKWFDAARGYGFIAPDGPIPGVPNDLFVHARDLPGTGAPEAGTRVEFELAEAHGRHAGKLRASRVRVLA